MPRKSRQATYHDHSETLNHDTHSHKTPLSKEDLEAAKEAEKRRQIKNVKTGRKKTAIACINCYQAKVR